MRLGPSTSRRRGPNRPRIIRPPVGFPWTPTFNIIESSEGVFTTDLDYTALAPTTAATLYADASRPNNGGNGQSAATAEQAIWAALNDVVTTSTIYIKGSSSASAPTLYGWAKAWRVGTAANLKIKVLSDLADTASVGYAVSSTALVEGDGELGTWALTADVNGPNVYEASLATAPGRVVDASSIGTSGPATLTSRASVALVEANPGSYYHSGTALFVRTSDSRDPDANLRPLRGGTAVNGHVNTASTVYIERLSFEGGSARCLYVQNGATVVLVDCDIWRGTALGLELNTAVGVTNATIYVYVIRCRFLGNAGDGCGYTANGSGMTIRAFEWGCTYSGNSGAGTDQGGSGHFTAGNTEVSIIRLNPICNGNKSQGFADVGGCNVWIIDPTISGEVTGVYCGDAGTTWIHGGTLSSNTTDLVTDAAGGTIYVSGTAYTTTSGDGTEGTVYSP